MCVCSPLRKWPCVYDVCVTPEVRTQIACHCNQRFVDCSSQHALEDTHTRQHQHSTAVARLQAEQNTQNPGLGRETNQALCLLPLHF